MFSENYQNAKKISILLKSKRIEEAKPLMKKISDNYIKLLDYFPENAKEGFKTGALPSIWENKDEFNALMKKASDDMIKLVKPKWYENKWLWFSLGVITTAGSIKIAGELVD